VGDDRAVVGASECLDAVTVVRVRGEDEGSLGVDEVPIVASGIEGDPGIVDEGVLGQLLREQGDGLLETVDGLEERLGLLHVPGDRGVGEAAGELGILGLVDSLGLDLEVAGDSLLVFAVGDQPERAAQGVVVFGQWRSDREGLEAEGHVKAGELIQGIVQLGGAHSDIGTDETGGLLAFHDGRPEAGRDVHHLGVAHEVGDEVGTRVVRQHESLDVAIELLFHGIENAVRLSGCSRGTGKDKSEYQGQVPHLPSWVRSERVVAG
jgi:hypothetical protein